MWDIDVNQGRFQVPLAYRGRTAMHFSGHLGRRTLLWGTWASQVALVVKNPFANAEDIRDSSLITGSGKSPGGEHGSPLSCLENPHGQRSLAGYGPWGRKESDMTERLHWSMNVLVSLSIYPLMDILVASRFWQLQLKHHVQVSLWT